MTVQVTKPAPEFTADAVVDDEFRQIKMSDDGRQLYIPPDDNGISRSSLTRSQANDN